MNAEYQSALNRAIQTIDSFFRMFPGKRVHVVARCKWGKHRSVAWAEDLRIKVLRAFEGSLNVVLVHLERCRWDNTWGRGFRGCAI